MYRDQKTGKIISFHSELRKLRPNTSMPTVLTEDHITENGFDIVTKISKPECTIIQKVMDTGVQLIDGEWQQTWEIVDKTQEELETLKTQRLNELASLRYQKEIAGITVGESNIRTDLVSQSKIMGSWCTAQINPSALIDFKGENGWVQIDSATIIDIATAVSNHVQACYTREKELSILLETDIEIDITTGWPER